MKSNWFLVFFMAAFHSVSSLAKDCRFVVTREVCSEKMEAELLKPYKGQKSVEMISDVETAQECLQKAEISSKVLKPFQFRSKKVDKIFFDQKSLDMVFEDAKECR
jgi:hypothetical protein